MATPRVMPYFLIGGGVLFLWSGLTGKKWSTVFKDLIGGKNPVTAPQAQGITGTPLSAIQTAGYGGSGIGSAGAAPAVHGIYTNSDLQRLWIAAGGNPAKAAVAACIADHESSGNPNAESPNPDGGTNAGLWQLDTNGVGKGLTVAQLKNPMVNARRTVSGSSNGTNWSAWATAAGCGA
jgi:hypothetical protein